MVQMHSQSRSDLSIAKVLWLILESQNRKMKEHLQCELISFLTYNNKNEQFWTAYSYVQQNRTKDVNREDDLLQQVPCVSLAVRTDLQQKQTQP